MNFAKGVSQSASKNNQEHDAQGYHFWRKIYRYRNLK